MTPLMRSKVADVEEALLQGEANNAKNQLVLDS